MKRRFHTIDVFTQQPLAGNPLAVVHDCAGLDTVAMQKIAREFNLSETVFVLPPHDAVNTARIRIFTPGAELPFAGHPTVGAAILLAGLRAPKLAGGADLSIVLEMEIGLVQCTVRLARTGASYAYFSLPQLPGELAAVNGAALEAALSLSRDDLGFDRHIASFYSAGVPFLFAPVSSLSAIARAQPDTALLQKIADDARGIYLYTKETVSSDHQVHARMFSIGLGIAEDPATGGAAAAFAGVAMAFEQPDDGEHTLLIEQGYEMGRPSLITLGMSVENGRLEAATIGGNAIIISEGMLDL